MSRMNLFKRWSNIYYPRLKIKVDYWIQTILKRKLYLGIGVFLIYVPASIITVSKYEKQTSLYITKGMQKLSDIQIPKSLRSIIFSVYCKYYNVNKQQMIKEYDQYKTLSEFFIRKVKQRPLSKQILNNDNIILSPCDSKILSFGQVKQDSVFVLKGYSYSLGYLLCGQQLAFTQQDINAMKKYKDNKLYHVVLYLAPGDYHRFHSMTNFDISRRKVIQGALLSVNQKSLTQKQHVYEKNSRLILHGRWKQGYLGMILVGALNVGRIVVKQKLNFIKGQQIGYFNLGSTVLLLIQSSNIEWKIQQRQKVRYNDVIGEVIKVNNNNINNNKNSNKTKK